MGFMSSITAVQNQASHQGTRHRWKELAGWMAASLAVLYSVVLAGFYYAMEQPPETFSRVMMHAGPLPFLLFPFETMWKHARAGALQMGNAAPDFRLPLLDGSGSVELSSFRGDRPVVLIFGSYT
jgi:hypothetical protein